MVIRCVLLVATDGLYDMLSNERAVGVAFDHWGDPASAAVELVKEAGECDKITVWCDATMSCCCVTATLSPPVAHTDREGILL